MLCCAPAGVVEQDKHEQQDRGRRPRAASSESTKQPIGRFRSRGESSANGTANRRRRFAAGDGISDRAGTRSRTIRERESGNQSLVRQTGESQGTVLLGCRWERGE